MAPEDPDVALAAAPEVLLGAAELVEDSEWPEWSSPASLSVLLDHSALKLEVAFVQLEPRVSLVPVAKLTAAHY